MGGAGVRAGWQVRLRETAGAWLVGAAALWERRPRRDGPGTVHPASRPGGRSYRQGVCPSRRVDLVGAAAWPRRVAGPCSLLRGRATAPTGMVCARCWRLWWEAAAPPRWVWHRASRFAARRPLLPRCCVPGAEGFGGSGGPAAMGLAPCIPLRGQAAAPTRGGFGEA